MAHIVLNGSRWVIDIDTVKGYVFLQTRWQYTWLTAGGVSGWTYGQKKKFHADVDRAIWRAWSNRVKLSVSGAAPFARRFGGRPIPTDLDVKWVTANRHWDVRVTKVAPGTFVQSEVEWTNRVIRLDTEDVMVTTKCNDVPHAGLESFYASLPGPVASHPLVTGLLTTNVCRQQVPVAHEFGHAAGNTAVLNRGDEYRRSSPNIGDPDSLLNIGNQLRTRHFRTILDDLNTMIAGCTFSVHTIRN